MPVFEMFTGPAERASDTPRGQLEAFFAQVEAMVKLPEFRAARSRTPHSSGSLGWRPARLPHRHCGANTSFVGGV